MSVNDLRQFIALLDVCGELARIRVEADPLLEIAAITDTVCKERDGGRALLFEHPRGSRFPLATNLFGSQRRVELALGVGRLDLLDERMSALLDRIPAPVFDRLDSQIAALPEFSRFAPVAGQEPDPVVMEPPDLTVFPFLHSWPADGSVCGFPRYVTLPLVFSADPDAGTPNCGMYRCQVRGAREVAIRWSTTSGAARHLEQFRQRGERMPLAICLGGPPVATFSALFPLPGDLDEMAFAGFLANEPIPMVPCSTVPLRVPAGSEVVIEGYVDPGETVVEGPFGNHTGCYSPAGPAPLLRVTAIRHRPDAVILATVVGPPPMEDCWMARAWERLLRAFLRRLVPVVADIHFPLEWVFHQSAVISLENPRPGMVRETAELLWLLPWFGAARLLVFVDAEADGGDFAGVAWRGINLAEFRGDLFPDASGRRWALDATGSSLALQRIAPDPAVSELVARRWQEYGFTPA
ncbi:MAG TPA: UbiD family decarboxylase, partial [Desulfuromonadaceae bacterium]